LRPGLVWGFDFVDGRALPVDDIELLTSGAEPRGFRWLHFNLADQRTLRWLGAARPFPARFGEIFPAIEPAQHGVVDGEALGLAPHDLELDFFSRASRGTARW